MNRRSVGLAALAATGALWSGGRALGNHSPSGVPRPSVCELDPGEPAAAFALIELSRYLGDLDELCGAAFVDTLREVAGALPAEDVDPASLVAEVPVTSAPPGVTPTTAAPLVAVPAVSGLEEIVAAGVAVPGPELDALTAAAAAFCAAPDDGFEALVSATEPLGDRVGGWTSNRIAITLVGEQCAPAMDALIERLDFSR
jgi:hypothetical protein